ncbi:MAG: MBOAT family protein [Lachnospiraceae bacterium]|nr:MBOAT family protein [Lachnospiraceae bacterium]
MSYTSFIYLLFLAIACLSYYLMPVKARWAVLLWANIVFYLFSGWDNFIFLLGAIAVSYFVACKMSDNHAEFKALKKSGTYDRKELKVIKEQYEAKRKKMLLIGLAFVILLLVVVKYTNFILGNVYSLLELMGFEHDQVFFNIIMPMGISFFVFQIIAYLMDVYRGDIDAQKNFLRYSLYISFFPTVVQGPIPRYKFLGTQLENEHPFSYENIRDGAIQIIWGFAKKLILSERLATFVSQIYDNYAANSYKGIILVIATVAFSIQIYADFSGCMDIATGSARLFGIQLPDNFLRPYFSKNMPEFWRRWHVSLGTWFKDYVLYPFSISPRLLKLNKNIRAKFGAEAGRIIFSAIPIYAVWMLTGVWHGAQWNYIIWGLFHGTLIVMSMIYEPYNKKVIEKLQIKTDCFSFRLFQMARTFTLCCVGRVFFRANGFMDAMGIFKNMFSGLGLEFIRGGRIFEYGLNRENMLVVLIAIVVLWIVSMLQEKMDVLEALSKQNLIFRWAIIYALFFAVLIFGQYGPGYDSSSFIYEQF